MKKLKIDGYNIDIATNFNDKSARQQRIAQKQKKSQKNNFHRNASRHKKNYFKHLAISSLGL